MLCCAAKSSSDAARWSAWLRRYRDRLQREADEGEGLGRGEQGRAGRTRGRGWVEQGGAGEMERGGERRSGEGGCCPGK